MTEPSANILENLLYNQENQNLIHNALIRHLEGEFYFGPHCHKNIELCIMQKGECDIVINGESITVHKNEYMVLFPNSIHAFKMKPGKSSQFLQMHFRSDSFLNLNPKMYKDLKFLYYIETETKQYLQSETNTQILSCVERISRELDTKSLNFVALANLYIYELILLLSREIQQSFHEVLSVQNPYTFKAMRYINENIENRITLDDIANECNISKRYLTQVFKTNAKITVNDYITITKINKAMDYIYENNCSLTDISFRLGFSSVQYFSSIFKQRAGVTPKEFRQLHNREN